MAFSDDLRGVLMRLNRAKTPMDRAKIIASIRPGHLTPSVPQNVEPRTGMSRGEHMAITAKEWGITREAQDELAVASHRSLAAAYDRGFFDDLVTPYLGLSRDGNLRPDTTVEKLASLAPVFGKGEGATMTAGNSTPLTDGASAVLLSTAEWAADHRITPLAWFVDGQAAAVDYVNGGDGLLTAPISVSYTHLRAHETVLDIVCRLLLEKKTIHTHYSVHPDKTTHNSYITVIKTIEPLIHYITPTNSYHNDSL